MDWKPRTLVDKATLALGYGARLSTSAFVARAIWWLEERLGDLHIETKRGDGWWVLSCTRGKGIPSDGISGRSIETALARAVIAVAKTTEGE